jgi:hypothetical protein
MAVESLRLACALATVGVPMAVAWIGIHASRWQRSRLSKWHKNRQQFTESKIF